MRPCLTHHWLRCRCPGMFSGQGCGAELRYWPVADGGFYRCPRKGCGHQEWALQREGSPQVALEGVDGATFKVGCLPAASLFISSAEQLQWDCRMS